MLRTKKHGWRTADGARHTDIWITKSLPEQSSGETKKKRLIRLLLNKGNHQHKLKVIEEKKGQMLLSRRSNTEDFRCCHAESKNVTTRGGLLTQNNILAGRITGNPSQYVFTKGGVSNHAQ